MTVVLVTGSSGLVGSAIARELTTAGWAVHGLDTRPGDWTTHVGDLRSPSVRASALDGVTAVVHTAALHAPHVGEVPASEFWSVNVDATADLLASCAGVTRFVYTSSTSVYGHALVPQDRAVWVTEHLKPQPRDIYDETKLAAETLVLDSELSTVVLRIARCFPEPPQVQAAHRLYRGVSLDDVAQAHRLALASQATGVLNIAGNYPFSPTDTVELWNDAPAVIVRKAPDILDTFTAHNWPLPARIDRVYDSTLAKKLIGYSPT
ncbi:NAD(P)-dependent oxidoreductase [Actinocrispum sp. NPDC049592]|uniref:NAD-dependent epimerase/dehydratase family protein n=1 Tax=Actinocrispum sp. NPDC049592 TaxID=3154835 RepID=UPI00341C323B